MNWSEFPSGGDDPSPPRKKLQLQGPRPAPLRVQKEQNILKKPPHPPAAQRPTRLVAAAEMNRREPVIIYAVSPRVLYVDESEFMTVVQRLTGPSLSSDDLAVSGAGDVSPAARLASIERTSPTEREKERERASEAMNLAEGGAEMSQIQGILTPGPASLPPIPAGFFSPVSDPHAFSILHDLSPFLQYGSGFLPSPSTLFSAPIISPTLQYDLFNYDF